MAENRNIETATDEQANSAQQPLVEYASAKENESSVPTELLTTSKQNQLTKNTVNENISNQKPMEVHPPHHLTHKKKWSEYLLEFFMLFLAVFLGFTAENIREHNIERHREKDYLSSFINNLKRDTAELKYSIARNDRKKLLLDSLLTYSHANFSDTNNIRKVYEYFLRSRFFPNYIPSDAALSQLKNSGNLRLIQKVDIVDSILAYDSKNKTIGTRADLYQTIINTSWESSFSVLDLTGIKSTTNYQNNIPFLRTPILSKDPDKLKYFFNMMFRERFIVEIFIDFLKQQVIAAEKLIPIINKEYQLESE